MGLIEGFVVVTDKEDSWWDALVISQKGHFMQTSTWARVKEERGWKIVRLAFFRGGQVKCCAQLLVRSIVGIKISYAPRGPILLGDDADLKFFFEGLKKYLADQGSVFCRFDPYAANFTPPPFPWIKTLNNEWSPWNAPRSVMHLQLPASIDEYLQLFDSKSRNNMLMPYKKGVEFFSETSENHIDDFYRLMQLTANKKSISVHGKEYYLNIVKSFSGITKLRCFYAAYDGEIISCGMTIVSGEVAWLLYAASDPKYLKLRASTGLQLEMLKWAIDEGCTLYDFRGAATKNPPSENDRGYGVYSFKKKFGSKFTVLSEYFDVVNNKAAYTLLRQIEVKLLPIAEKVMIALR